MCKIPLVWNISLRRPHGGGPLEVQYVWSVFKYVIVSYIVRPLYEFHSQWNLQSNIKNPVKAQKHGELFHASWNLQLYLVLRQGSVEHPPKKYVSYRVEGHKKQRAQKQRQLQTTNNARRQQQSLQAMKLLRQQQQTTTTTTTTTTCVRRNVS
jgi:hypothetical protein